MSTSAKTALKIVFGAMTFGEPGKVGVRVNTTEEAGKILDVFQSHGHNEIDTARVYGNGTTEATLAELSWEKRGLVMDTKLYPNAGNALMQGITKPGSDTYTLQAPDVRRGLLKSLEVLKSDKVDMFYLHGPDRNTPLEDTLEEVNKLYLEKRFQRFGISNFMSWEVAQMCEICKRNGWIMPTAYQGVYHALQRTIEAELFPCLRFYGISLYAFQPLAGGFLTGRYTRGQDSFEAGSRFDPKIPQGAMHRGRYWNDSYFDALENVTAVAEKHGFTIAEVALRWIEHHSLMKKDHGDAIIVGASSIKHLEGNLADLEKGSLPEEIVEALEKAWLHVKSVAPKYWH